MGIVGRTGAGKSSLASLLLRVLQPRQGRVSLGGRDTSTVGLQQLRAKVTIVPQVKNFFWLLSLISVIL